MTILPKKKAQKEKKEGENSEHPPRSPTGDSLGHLPPSPPPRWNSPSPRDERHDPGDRLGHKRRLRSSSSPHRTTRKHRHERHDRHERHERHERSTWDGGARPRIPQASQLRPLDIVPSTSNEQENIPEGHNSDDEYGAQAAPDNNNELEDWFVKALKEKRGFIIKPMVDDGACMFRSVADQVFGDQEMHHAVRKNCIDYMAKNRDFFSQWVTEDFNIYLARKSQPNCHGNHIEMQVMSEIYNRPIEVYQYNTEPMNTFISATYGKTDNVPIRVSYHGNVHYNSVVDPYTATVGVGLGLPGFQPGLAEKNLLTDAKKKSEAFHIEQTMLEDKIRETDWETTQESIEEQVARESFIQFLAERDKRTTTRTTTAPPSASATVSSAAAAASAGATWWPSSSPSPPPAVAGCSSSTPLRHQVSNDGAVAGSSSRRSPPPQQSSSSSRSSASASAPPVPDFNPELFGFTMGGGWDDDDIMQQVMAASQQEYINSFKNNMSPARSDHSPPPPPPPPPPANS